MRIHSIERFVALSAVLLGADAFTVNVGWRAVQKHQTTSRTTALFAADSANVVVGDFIGTELRGAAMKLHTREQSPKEGEVEAPKREPYATTRDDYLGFLVDSQHAYKAFEDVVNEIDELSVFRNTGLERVEALEKDIEFMVAEYGLTRPEVQKPGLDYAEKIRGLGERKAVPEFVCHYYNHYFAHTAGGRMIGKKMSSMLLDKKTLEFYKWEGDLNEIKAKVKQDIEDLVATFTREQKDACVNETAGAFQDGGMLNSRLAGMHKSS